MNLVDVFILLLVVVAVAHGFVQGAATQALSFGGFAIGLVAGALLARPAADLSADPGIKAVISLVVLFGVASLGATVGRTIGIKVWGRIQDSSLRLVDGGLGAVLGGASTLVVCWLIAGMLASAPPGEISSQIHDSTILRSLDGPLPATPSVFSRISRLLEARGFPRVFADFDRRPAAALPPPSSPQVRAALAAAGPSTVKVTGNGCGGELNGSGFVAAPGLVVTNAHVVAGIDRPFVEDKAGRHRATAVVFDPALDVAVLRVSGLAGRPLDLVTRSVDRGTAGAVLGYPGGGALDTEPGVVLDHFDAVGRDIYGRNLTRRPVYELQAKVRPGNSGGPYVDFDGNVIGLVFSRSTINQSVGYAIPSTQVQSRLTSARQTTTEVDTGPCAAA